MRNKIILNLAMSIDGYIADKNGGVDWLQGDGSSPNGTESDIFKNFLNTIDVIVMGYGAYEATKSFAPLKQQFPNQKIYVMTSKDIDEEGVEVFRGTPKEFVDGSKGNVWMFGGGLLANSFFKEDLITNLELGIIPTILGDGIKMFHELNKELKWKFIKQTQHDGIVFLSYERKK